MTTTQKNTGSGSPIDSAIQTYRLADHPTLFEDVAKRLGIVEYATYFLDREPIRDGVRKFHTPQLAVNQALNAYEGAMWAGFPTPEIKAAVLAALYQDWLHPQGYYSGDLGNVNVAVRGFAGAHAGVPEHVRLHDRYYEMVVGAIRDTARPYSKNRPCHSQISKILRDAWTMWVHYHDESWCLQQMVGMLNEMNGSYHDVSPHAFIARLNTERASYQWSSTWGTVKSFHLNYPQRVKNLERLFLKKVEADARNTYSLASA